MTGWSMVLSTLITTRRKNQFRKDSRKLRDSPQGQSEAQGLDAPGNDGEVNVALEAALASAPVESSPSWVEAFNHYQATRIGIERKGDIARTASSSSQESSILGSTTVPPPVLAAQATVSSVQTMSSVDKLRLILLLRRLCLRKPGHRLAIEPPIPAAQAAMSSSSQVWGPLGQTDPIPASQTTVSSQVWGPLPSVQPQTNVHQQASQNVTQHQSNAFNNWFIRHPQFNHAAIRALGLLQYRPVLPEPAADGCLYITLPVLPLRLKFFFGLNNRLTLEVFPNPQIPFPLYPVPQSEFPSGPGLLLCPQQCGHAFATQDGVQAHLAENHVQDGAHRCPRCPCRYANGNALKNHRARRECLMAITRIKLSRDNLDMGRRWMAEMNWVMPNSREGHHNPQMTYKESCQWMMFFALYGVAGVVERQVEKVVVVWNAGDESVLQFRPRGGFRKAYLEEGVYRWLIRCWSAFGGF
ncbi:hypothetical protein BJ508DRAFT_310820 [Ascobolus immersus RN42]|uniref:C2H2-type domain-containing protein n=1 Tax=Ascobolus immersus RN42 TaxID=1160509 RepID=A0A3N4HTU9_ASCIM|nr:hypothetical protein BJ508DRAFT_310820 [Ascobolus immersus RN42]